MKPVSLFSSKLRLEYGGIKEPPGVGISRHRYDQVWKTDKLTELHAWVVEVDQSWKLVMSHLNPECFDMELKQN